MSAAPFVLVLLSRRRCCDMGEFFGTPRIVAHKVNRRMSRARLPVVATVRRVWGSAKVCMDTHHTFTVQPRQEVSL